MKLCKTCRKTKTEDCFYKHNKTKDGLFPECKLCNISRATKWNKANPENRKENKKRDWHKHREERLKTTRKNWDLRDFAGMRRSVLERDGYMCISCGLTNDEHLAKWGTSINIDHINRDRTNNTLENLQVLCLHCHGKKDNRFSNVGLFMEVLNV